MKRHQMDLLSRISTHTPLARRDMRDHFAAHPPKGISTHTPLARRDIFRVTIIRKIIQFLLTRLLRGVTGHGHLLDGLRAFLLTRLLRGVTSERTRFPVAFTISTHTPLARRDQIGQR